MWRPSGTSAMPARARSAPAAGRRATPPSKSIVARRRAGRGRRSPTSVVVLPAPFGPTSADDLALVDVERDAAHGGDAAVADVEVLDAQHRRPSRRAARDTPRARPGRARTSAGVADRDRLAVVEHLDPLAEAHDQAACRARSRASPQPNVVADPRRAPRRARRSRPRSGPRPARRAAGTAARVGERAGDPEPPLLRRAGAPAAGRSATAAEAACDRAARAPRARPRVATRRRRRAPTSTFSSTRQAAGTGAPPGTSAPTPLRASAVRAPAGDVDAAELRPSRRRPLEAGERVDERRLARAVRADQAEDLALAHGRGRRRRPRGAPRSGLRSPSPRASRCASPSTSRIFAQTAADSRTTGRTSGPTT